MVDLSFEPSGGLVIFREFVNERETGAPLAIDESGQRVLVLINTFLGCAASSEISRNREFVDGVGLIEACGFEVAEFTDELALVANEKSGFLR